jgi:hypothetical protein
MRQSAPLATILAVFAFAPMARAGLHYSAEPFAELPSQWRGFMLDWRALRGIAAPASSQVPASPLRKQYQDEAQRFRDVARSRLLTVDEKADFGAVLLRLGESDAALDVLREAQRTHPKHYATLANLGTAWQLAGDLEQASDCLRQAVVLAPGKNQRVEELHLRLVRQRMRQSKDAQELDDLFGVHYVGESRKFEPGKLAAAERKKLPSDAVANVQLLALWFPGDARLLWQLAELANAHGDVRTAADLMDICVSQFGLSSPDLRERRVLAKEAAEALAKAQALAGDGVRTEHTTGHADAIKPKSRRPLALKRFDTSALPPITKDSINPLPWALLLETNLDRKFRPTFAKYLQELDGCQIRLLGYLQPLGEDLDAGAFMLIEYPVGCWYCEMPEVNGIVLVELPENKTFRYTRNLVTITGKLKLNSTDPEDFLYTIKDAKVVESD